MKWSEACIDGTLDQVDLQFEDNAAVCVVLASEGYPVTYEKGFPISRIWKNSTNMKDIIASMQEQNLMGIMIVTNGGRVLGVTAKGKDLKRGKSECLCCNRVGTV